LELETLGPIRRIEPDDEATHEITWKLHGLPDEAERLEADAIAAAYGPAP